MFRPLTIIAVLSLGLVTFAGALRAQERAQGKAPEKIREKAEKKAQETDKAKDKEKPAARKTLDTVALTGPMQSAPALFGNLKLESAFDRSLASPGTTTIEEGPAVCSSTFCWAAPNFYHQPLLFEQPYLERFGAGAHPALQPFTAGLNFYGRIPFLPYSLLKHPTTSRDYTLGYRRPGDCVTNLPLIK